MLIWAMHYLKYLQGMLGFKGVFFFFLRSSVNSFCSNILTQDERRADPFAKLY